MIRKTGRRKRDAFWSNFEKPDELQLEHVPAYRLTVRNRAANNRSISSEPPNKKKKNLNAATKINF